jgi:hypothetical protein
MAYDGETISWQSEVGTNRVPQYGIAIGTELAVPATGSIPLGGRIDWTDEANWSQIAVYLTDDDISIEPTDEDGIEINPPTAPGIVALIRDKIGVRRINFTSYEVGAKLLQYATNMEEIDVSGNADSGSCIWAEKQEHSRVSLAIEILGIGILLFPSVEIKALPPVANVKKAATQEVVVDVFCVTFMGGSRTNVFLEYGA